MNNGKLAHDENITILLLFPCTSLTEQILYLSGECSGWNKFTVSLVIQLISCEPVIPQSKLTYCVPVMKPYYSVLLYVSCVSLFMVAKSYINNAITSFVWVFSVVMVSHYML